ncbi:MAG: hypothetical protein ACLP8A_13650 [Methylovirgula sp.]
MTASIFIARLLGPMFLIVSIALLLKRAMFHAILEEFTASRSMLYLAGFFGLLGGIALVLTHNIWVGDWRLIITLIGWVTIFRAVATIFAPELVVEVGRKILSSQQIFFAAAGLNFLIGLVLTYFGFFA